VPGYRIDRLGLTAVALGGADVDQQSVTSQRGGACRVYDGHVAGASSEIARRDILGGTLGSRCGTLGGILGCGCYGKAGGGPGAVTAVQDANARVAEVTQVPPRPGGGHGLAVVVHDYHAVVADAGAAHCALEGLRRWQRMTAAVAGRGGQVTVQVYEHGCGDVAGPVAVDTGRAAEAPADIQHDRRHRRGQLSRQASGIDQQSTGAGTGTGTKSTSRNRGVGHHAAV
jgi:hypothetical protein